jgi:anaerobic magnesium-protoporphyrin IX monomethyl ester cyclase
MNNNSEKTTITLIFPFFWSCDYPYASLACLQAMLKKNYYNVKICDLNLSVNSLLLSKNYFQKVLKELKSKNLNNEFIEYFSKEKLDIIEKAKKIIKDNTFIEEKLYWAYRVIQKADYLIKMLFYVDNPEYTNYHKIVSIDLAEALNCSKINKCSFFYKILENFIDKYCKESGYVGISIAGTSQLIPSLTLARIIKSKYPNKKIVFGGAISKFAENAVTISHSFFEIVDAFIIGDGETSLINWLKFNNKHKPKLLTNIIYYNSIKNKIIKSSKYIVEDMNKLPRVDYSNYPLSEYYFNNMFTYSTSRGCSWGKCTFCTHTAAHNRKYMTRNIDLVIDDIKHLKKMYNLKYLIFTDNSIQPSRILSISKAIKNEKIKWQILARFSKKFNLKIFKTASEAGLKIIMFGLESCSKKVLEAMNKNISLRYVTKNLQQAKENNIITAVFLIFGFPAETLNDAVITHNFMLDLKNSIDICICNEFYLEVGSFIYFNPSKFNIKNIYGDKKYFIGPNCKFVKTASQKNQYNPLEYTKMFLNDVKNDFLSYPELAVYSFPKLLTANNKFIHKILKKTN